jgi:hypothetical protein
MIKSSEINPLIPASFVGGAVCLVLISDGVTRCFLIVVPSLRSHNRTIESEQPAATCTRIRHTPSNHVWMHCCHSRRDHDTNDASDDTVMEHTLVVHTCTHAIGETILAMD